MALVTQEGASRRIRTKNWDVHYSEVGEGFPVVLVHGGGPGASGWSNYNPNIPALSKHYRVLAIDLPGWGQSQPVSYEQRDNSGVLAEFLEALGIKKAALVGNSMGGASVIRLAYERPELVSHLITMGSPSGVPGIFEAGGLTEGVKVLERAYFAPSLDTIRALTNVMTFDSSNVTDELIAERLQNTLAQKAHVDNWIAGHGKGPMVRLNQELIATIKAPTLLMHGRDDRVTHFTHAIRLAGMIRNSRALIVNRCGHWLQLEHAAEFNSNVHRFIQDNPVA
ncbi:alpha/beta fold hydrolase [Candidatus Viadribacter manganicus]|uniref:Alpha/beta hydrolase n=1 Tax=Candidatus Viadribacter manganicus TaxID=1759059 RepID=A0A1B1AM14_9PROT|nr:alpha/beta hydrolase [Candidatus Viadribacter manganicus]ANP47575.1 alpha/beta hydrolase [Candidatus Viadribacter manganicus]